MDLIRRDCPPPPREDREVRRRCRDAREAESSEHGFVVAEPRLAELRAQVKAPGCGPAAAEGCRRARPVARRGTAGLRAPRPLAARHYVFGAQAPDAGNIEILHKFGTAQQKATWLEPLARGDIRSCFSMTEPENPGSNRRCCRVRRAATEDHYVIDGHKWFTTAADGAAFAIVMAVTNPDAPKHARASMIIVPTSTPGFGSRATSRSWAMPARGTAATVRSGTAARACPSRTASAEGAGFMIAQERLGPGRIHHWHAVDRDLRARVRSDVHAHLAPQDRRREDARDAPDRAGVGRGGARRDQTRRA